MGLINYCPVCGSKLTWFESDVIDTEGFGNCPKHGFINIEYWKPSWEPKNLSSTSTIPKEESG